MLHELLDRHPVEIAGRGTRPLRLTHRFKLRLSNGFRPRQRRRGDCDEYDHQSSESARRGVRECHAQQSISSGSARRSFNRASPGQLSRDVQGQVPRPPVIVAVNRAARISGRFALQSVASAVAELDLLAAVSIHTFATCALRWSLARILLFASSSTTQPRTAIPSRIAVRVSRLSFSPRIGPGRVGGVAVQATPRVNAITIALAADIPRDPPSADAMVRRIETPSSSAERTR